MRRTRYFKGFAELRDHVLDTFYNFYPTLASTLGLHAWDGKVEDFSAEHRQGYLDQLLEAREALTVDFALPAVDPTERFERRSLLWKLNDEIFRLTEYREFEWNPLVYNDLIEVAMFFDRDYAPMVARMRSATQRLRAVPRVLAIARQNLLHKLDRTIVETAISVFEGRLEYYELLPSLTLDYIADSPEKTQLLEALETAKSGVRSFIESLQVVVLPDSLYDSFRLGTDRLRKFLQSAELVTESLEELVVRGHDEIHRMKNEMIEVCRELDPTMSLEEAYHHYVESEAFSEQSLVRETSSMLERIRSFVIEKHLISVPSEVRCKVEPTPAHMRWAFAAMNSPGAFETIATEAFYYVTPPESSWDEAKKREYLKGLNRSVMELISIHEAYPGHYIHFLHLQHVKSRVGKSFWSYAFIEGWAHYTEEMMIEAGWGAGDHRIRLAYLQESLIRLCRYMTSLLLHQGAITLNEAQRMFEDKALMRPVSARKEAERALFDPGYLFYTLGRMQIRALRKKLEARPGFSLEHFHNEFLCYGTAPVRIIEEMMLGE